MDPTSKVTLHTGRRMPVIGLGTWQLTNDTADTILNALRVGYRLIDTSGDYGSQPGIGEALGRTDIPREQIYLVAKVEEDEDAYASTKRNLGEMRQDYADLMLIHRPPDDGVGVELWQGLMRARDEGLARDIGVSNYSVEQMEKLIEATGEKPVVNQIEWTPFGWSQDMLDWCRQNDVVIQAYSPLTRATRLDDETVQTIADAAGRTPGQVLIRWGLQQGVVPLPKANSEQHQRENFDVFGFELGGPEMDALSALNELDSALGDRLQYV